MSLYSTPRFVLASAAVCLLLWRKVLLLFFQLFAFGLFDGCVLPSFQRRCKMKAAVFFFLVAFCALSEVVERGLCN